VRKLDLLVLDGVVDLLYVSGVEGGVASDQFVEECA